MEDKEDKKEKGGGLIPKIRTFQEDASDYIKEKDISKLDIETRRYIHSQKTIKEEKPNFLKRNLRTILIAGVVLFSLLMVVWVLWSVVLQNLGFVKIPTNNTQDTLPLFIPVDDKKTITFLKSNPASLTEALKIEQQKNLAFGTTIQFDVIIEDALKGKSRLDSSNLIQSFGWSPPTLFQNNVKQENYLFITYNKLSHDLIFVFEVKDFAKALEAMFSWEPKLWVDLKPFLGNQDFASLEQQPFIDKVVQNNDIRLLKNSAGETVITYTFFNKRYLILSTSEVALEKVIKQLIAFPPA
jgi:hypothetical protein